MLNPLTTDIGPQPITTVRRPGESDEDMAERHRDHIRAVLAAIRAHAGLLPQPYQTRGVA